jgi:hypothetical protein
MSTAADFAAHPLDVPAATIAYEPVNPILQHSSAFCRTYAEQHRTGPLSASLQGVMTFVVIVTVLVVLGHQSSLF